MPSYLLVEFHVLHHFQSKREIAKQAVHAQQSDDTEVPKHPVKGLDSVLSNDLPE